MLVCTSKAEFCDSKKVLFGFGDMADALLSVSSCLPIARDDFDEDVAFLECLVPLSQLIQTLKKE